MTRQWMTALLSVSALVGATGCAEAPTVATREACPSGTVAEVPAYRWENGGLIAKGWVCDSIYSDGG